MTIQRAAPGPQLSTGRLRVDAARAIAKLREYQLVDRTAWILEAIRAACASGATKLTLRGDANDIWLAWDGPAWPVDELPRLFDELVSPEPTIASAGGDASAGGESRYHLRLLAAAVNSALGSDPAYVDIYSIDAGEAQRARYTPDVLAEPTGDLDDSPLRRIAATPAPVPAGLGPETGMLVHLRRRAALGMLAYLFWERDPPELAAAAAACNDIGVPLVIGNRTLHRDSHGSDVTRIPLGDDLDGFVAIVDPRTLRAPHHEPTLEIAERGVVLARYPFPLPPPFGTPETELRGKVPLRVFLDAKRLPTNASRSQVRREVPPISTAEQRVPELVGKLIAGLAEAAAKPEVDDRTRAAAIAMIASIVGGLTWTSVVLGEQLGPLAQLALLRDATGVARPIGYRWTGQVYTGRSPLSEELAPWLEGMLWLRRGDPATAILAGIAIDAAETRRQIKLAKRMRASHRKFFDKAPARAALDLARSPRIKLRLGALVPGSCVPAKVFEGLTGELALTSDPGAGALLVLYQGRPIERISIASPIQVDAVIDTQQLTPGDGYRAVTRDNHYAVVETAARAAIVAAAEAVAASRWLGQPSPDGFSDGDVADHDAEARIVRSALGLARELGFPTVGPLRKAAAWRKVDETWISFDDIAKERVVGFTSGAVRTEIPTGRLMLTVGSQVLAKLLPSTKLVDYDRGRVQDDVRAERAAVIAAKMATTFRFALAVDDGDVRGAIAPSEKSTIRLSHTGRPLETRGYGQTLLPCSLIVDCDSIIPNRDWTASEDSGTALSRSYLTWEHALVRAAARTLSGDRPAELHGPEVSGLDNTLGRLLCRALPASTGVLDNGLVARLRAAPIVHVLGERDLISIDKLVALFPKLIPIVDKNSAPVIGYTPVVGDQAVGQAIATLTGLEVIDGSRELELRRRSVLRQLRITAHRGQAVLPLELPDSVAIEPAHFDLRITGVVAINTLPRLEIEVRVEGRPFETLTRSGELPLRAIVDLDPIHLDATFEALPEMVTKRLVDGVRRSARTLLLATATANPAALADPGWTRTLLVGWLDTSDRDRSAFLATKIFPTPYGTRIPLASAVQLTKTIWISRWQGEWLTPGDGEEPSPLDAGVLAVGPDADELEAVIRALHGGAVHDVSDQIMKLQGQRRMARGLIPTPSLPHIPGELKRKLSELDLKHKLGHGEIGLVAGAVSSVMIHVHGQPRERQAIDVLPAVHIAIEAPDLVTALTKPFEIGGDTVADQLARLRDDSSPISPGSVVLSKAVQELAQALVQSVVAKLSANALPVHIRRSLRYAILSRRISAIAPVFELIDGSWVGVDVLVNQIATYGSAWSIPKPIDQRPLDPDRRVFVLSLEETSAARGNYSFTDAASELGLDAAAAINRLRPLASSLDIGTPEDLLGVVDLPGDGERSPRGQVAALLPHAAHRRGLYLHRAMHPFDVVPDPCTWPTIALVDDRRLIPDRTWAAATDTAIRKDVVSRVQFASAEAIVNSISRPRNALAFARTDEGIDVTQSPHLQIRGAAWISGPPIPPIAGIDVFDANGSRLYVPAVPLGIGGRLYVMATTAWDSDTLLAKVIGTLYGHLVKKLESTNRDMVAAHRANALALGYTMPFDLPSDRFPGFRPEPLSATELVAMFRSRTAVRVLPIAEIEAELHEPEVAGVVEDGSLLSQVVLRHLARRVQRGGASEKPAAEPRRVVVAPEIEPIAKPLPAIPSPKRAHAIQGVVDHVRRRLLDLGVPGFDTMIVDRETPLVDFTRELDLRFAGNAPRLIALANAMQAKSPWADDGADALIAHAIAVMDAASKDINRETQLRVLEGLLIRG